MRVLFSALLIVCASFTFAQVDVSRSVVLLSKDASESEKYAAKELSQTLSQMTGKSIGTGEFRGVFPPNSILVSNRNRIAYLVPKLAPEEIALISKGRSLVVCGGSDRGTVYAAHRLLHRLGVRWWTPWASKVPKSARLTIPKLDVREAPAMEYREPFWYHAFDGDWAARNYSNGASERLGDERGGRIEYQGFVHTYFPLVPPDPNFATHPEWYSELGGKRVYANAQLCTTNPSLRQFVLEQVRAQLRANPRARIVSVSQNDCFNPCTCPVCTALAQKEGSQSALVLDLANFVADGIAKEFPDVAVDTLAYQWSRKPPLTMRPRKNVIVRLCSIECNFAYSLEAPQNASFGDDLRGWSKLTDRLYIWDYCTDFAHYIQPQPDYYTLGPTIRFFASHGVKGVFEEGAYQSNGGEMSELKAWLIAQLLWDPKQDDRKLIDEFLRGYYASSAPAMKEYLELMAKEAQSWNLTFASGSNASFLRYDVMKRADTILKRAEGMARTPEIAWRVRQAHLSATYVWLQRWEEFWAEAKRRGDTWPLNPSRKAVADQWLADATGKGPAGWTPITHIDEGGQTPAQFIARFAVDPKG